MDLYVQDPDALLDYTMDWRDENDEDGPYLEDGEALDTSSFTVQPQDDPDPADLTISGTPTNDLETATVWLENGVVGRTYVITNRITTDRGRSDERSFLVRIEHQ